MNIIFQIDGGIGKSIMGTAVCKAIRAQYPDDPLVGICTPDPHGCGFVIRVNT